MSDEFLIQTRTHGHPDGGTPDPDPARDPDTAAHDPAQICARLAESLTMLEADTQERNHAVAALWARLRNGPPARVACRIVHTEDHRSGVLTVDEEILAEVRLPTELRSLWPRQPLPTLLDIVTDQDIALIRHRQELESTDQGLLALHAELADQADLLTRSSERQRELLETEQAARAAAEAARGAAEAARSRLAFLSHVGAVLGASLDHRQVLFRLSTLLVPRFADQAQG